MNSIARTFLLLYLVVGAGAVMNSKPPWQFGMPLSQVRDVWARRLASLVTDCPSHPGYDGSGPPPANCEACADRWCVMERVKKGKEKEQGR